jgi:hypothetical protein
MKLYKMAQVDSTNIIVHISVWDDPSNAPHLIEVSDFADVGMNLKDLEDEE